MRKIRLSNGKRKVVFYTILEGAIGIGTGPKNHKKSVLKYLPYYFKAFIASFVFS